MLVKKLDHFNIVTDKLDETAQFYVDILGLERRDAPAPARADQTQWLYDGADQPIIHISSPGVSRPFNRAFPTGETGPIHHIALNCVDSEEIARRLEARGLDPNVRRIDSIGLTQVFAKDPNGVLLELNCFDD